MRPSIDVVFGDHYVAELVHIFIIVRRHNGEELGVTVDADGDIIACLNDFGCECSDDLLPEEIQSIKRLVKRRSVD